MAITVEDIEQKEFAYKGAGYDPYDVDQYLDQICDEMIAMKDRIDALEAELAKAKREAEVATKAVMPVQPEVVRTAAVPPVGQASQTLESILLNAQKLADGAVEDAKRRAEEIVKGAQDQASELLDDAKEEKATLEKSVEAMRSAAKDFRNELLTLIDEQKSLLNSKLTLFED